MIKVAVIRGQHLNKWEMQSYDGVNQGVSITAIGNYGGLHPLDGLRMRTRKLPSLDPLVSSSVAGSVFLQPLLWRLGLDNRLLGLERHLAGFDIVHTAESSLTFTRQAAHAKTRYGFKLVATCWETIPFLGDHIPFVYNRKRSVLPHIDRFIAMTPRAANALRYEGVPGSRISMIFPGIDLDHFRPLPRTAGDGLGVWRSPDAFRVLLVGRVEVCKGLRDLLLAISLIRSRIQPLEAAVVGNGNHFLVDSISDTLHLQGLVSVRRAVPYHAMPALYASADVFVLPSIPTPTWEEQFGMVLAESMACGKAVVTTRCGAIPEVVGDAAVLVPPYEPEALAEAIVQLASDTGRRQWLQERAIEHARRQFDRRRFALQLREIYLELVG